MSRAFSRAGSDQIENLTAPVTAYPFAILAWARSNINISGSGDDYCVVQIQDDGVANHYWRLQANDVDIGSNAGFGFGIAAGGGFTAAFGTTAVVANTWYHVAAVGRSATDREIWVDGVEEATDTTNATPSNIDSITIGREGDSTPADTWDGDIAHVSVVNVAPTAAQIAACAAGYHPIIVFGANAVVRHWELWGNDSPEPEEMAGADGTLTGTTKDDHPPGLIYPGTVSVAHGTAAAAGSTVGARVVGGLTIPGGLVA